MQRNYFDNLRSYGVQDCRVRSEPTLVLWIREEGKRPKLRHIIFLLHKCYCRMKEDYLHENLEVAPQKCCG